MPEYKKQHYVPQFYLKGFSPNGKSINIWNIQHQRKIQSASLKNQCSKNYFYNKQLVVEKALGEIEGQMAHIVKNMNISGTLPERGSPEHGVILVYVLMQYGRTQYSAETFDEFHDKLFKQLLLPTAKAERLDLDKVTFGIENAVLYSLAQVTQLYPVLLDLDFKLLTSNTDVEFVTSDNPVVTYNQLLSFRKFGSNTGFAAKGLQIFFPIGPKNILLFYDSNVYTIGKRSSRFVEINNSKDIYQINTLQMCSALNNVYFRETTLDIESLYRKALPFRRQMKASVDSFSHTNSQEINKKIISMAQIDVKTNLTLSFLQIKRNAKRWRTKFRRQNVQPVSVVRNPLILEACEEFSKKAENKEYKHSEFFRYLQSK